MEHVFEETNVKYEHQCKNCKIFMWSEVGVPDGSKMRSKCEDTETFVVPILKCECGSASAGVKPHQAGHAHYCPVRFRGPPWHAK